MYAVKTLNQRRAGATILLWDQDVYLGVANFGFFLVLFVCDLCVLASDVLATEKPPLLFLCAVDNFHSMPFIGLSYHLG